MAAFGSKPVREAGKDGQVRVDGRGGVVGGEIVGCVGLADRVKEERVGEHVNESTWSLERREKKREAEKTCEAARRNETLLSGWKMNPASSREMISRNC